MVTLTDIEPRTWDAAEGALDPADPRFRERLVAAYDEATTTFLAAGATDVLWVVPPSPPQLPERRRPRSTRAYGHYAEALREVAARHPGQVAVVDLAAGSPPSPSRPSGPTGCTGRGRRRPASPTSSSARCSSPRG